MASGLVAVNVRRVARAPLKHDQLGRIPDRQRPKHYRVDQAENSGVCANAQGQRENGHSRKAWRFREHTQAIMNVLPELLQPNETPHLARLFLYPLLIAELSSSLLTR